jgi:hypothetical protein
MHTLTRNGKAACAILPGAVEQRRQERGFYAHHNSSRQGSLCHSSGRCRTAQAGEGL